MFNNTLDFVKPACRQSLLQPVRTRSFSSLKDACRSCEFINLGARCADCCCGTSPKLELSFCHIAALTAAHYSASASPTLVWAETFAPFFIWMSIVSVVGFPCVLHAGIGDEQFQISSQYLEPQYVLSTLIATLVHGGFPTSRERRFPWCFLKAALGLIMCPFDEVSQLVR